MPDDERLMAYVDGELTASERATFKQRLDADPELRRRLAGQQELRRRLAAAFDPILEEPPPLRLTLAAQAANAPGRSRRPVQWAAMAACLALGVIVGRTALPQRGPLTTQAGALVAQGRLASALDQRLASEGGAIRAGVSFRSADGRYCRTFQSEPDKLAGVACRQPRGWVASTVTAWSAPAQQAGYRTAGSETPPPVLAAVDAMIAGEPLDAAGERAARDRHWRP